MSTQKHNKKASAASKVDTFNCNGTFKFDVIIGNITKLEGVKKEGVSFKKLATHLKTDGIIAFTSNNAHLKQRLARCVVPSKNVRLKQRIVTLSFS